MSSRPAYDLEAFQSNLNRLANLDGSYSAQYAANVWAGTVDEPLVNALNIVAGTEGVGLRGVVNIIAGTDNLGINEALRRIP